MELFCCRVCIFTWSDKIFLIPRKFVKFGIYFVILKATTDGVLWNIAKKPDSKAKMENFSNNFTSLKKIGGVENTVDNETNRKTLLMVSGRERNNK